MSRYFIQGKGEVQLGRADFKASGGEGSVYVKGSTAYKVFADPRRATPPAKILELSVLTHPRIIRPLDLLLDAGGLPAGYSMRDAGASHVLCQLFPRAFRDRKNLTPEMVLGLVRKMQEGITHVHSRGILAVDINEMNFLVSEDLGEVFFIDVDSYQTPSFPANVLMDSVRDRHSARFTTGSDWFSFAVISFQMFVGIHPFKGKYGPFQNLHDKDKMLDARMRSNISVLHAGVSVPGSCLPFDVIPPAYMDWYSALFEEGKRLPPPGGAQPIVIATSSPKPSIGSQHFDATELQEFEGEVVSYDGVITVTRGNVYFQGRKYPAPFGEVKAVVTPRLRRLVIAYVAGARVRLRDLTDGREIESAVAGDEVMTNGGRFYVRQKESLVLVEFIEASGRVRAAARAVGNVSEKSTRLFDGVAIQNLLGAYYAAAPDARGGCHQLRLRELDGYRVVDAKLYKTVLMVIGERGGRYDKLVFRFASAFGDYDVWLIPDLAQPGINFTVLDSGVALHLNDSDGLEIFSARKGAAEIKVVSDPALRGDAKLLHVGAQALFARGNKLFKFGMRQQSL